VGPDWSHPFFFRLEVAEVLGGRCGMRIDPIQANVPDLSRSSNNIQNLLSTPEAQLHQVEADNTVNAAVRVETGSDRSTPESSEKHHELEYTETGKQIVKIVDDSGKVVTQLPTPQVLEVGKQIEIEIEEKRAVDLRS
jgi:uncharacterized FlaG/YvyC family protein